MQQIRYEIATIWNMARMKKGNCNSLILTDSDVIRM